MCVIMRKCANRREKMVVRLAQGAETQTRGLCVPWCVVEAHFDSSRKATKIWCMKVPIKESNSDKEVLMRQIGGCYSGIWAASFLNRTARPM